MTAGFENDIDFAQRQRMAKDSLANAKGIEFVPPPPEIPPAMLAEMQSYARKLMVRHPGWKLAKVQRKTAEYYNIKFENAKTGSENPEG